MSKTVTNSMSAATKLSASQMSMLKAAAQREDRCLSPLLTLRGVQAVRAGEKLVLAGFAREVRAKGTWPIWRRDEETGAAFTLKLTTAGSKAIMPERGTPSVETAAEKPPAPLAAGTFAIPHLETLATITQDGAPRPTERPGVPKPRPTSKIAAVIGLLSRSGGATLADLIAATGWLPHSTRAALTGLRKRGYVVKLDRSDRNCGSVYLIDSRPADVPVAETENAAEAA